MKIEFEVKFFPINRREIIEKIKNLGGVCIKEKTLMKRVVFYHPTDKNSYARIRDEGEK